MKNKLVTLVSLLACSLLASCEEGNSTSQHSHIHSKGELLSISLEEANGVKDAGLFACKSCGEQYYDSIDSEDIGIPVIDLDGDFTDISKSNEKKISCSYDSKENSFSCDASIKIQGAFSTNFPKKNYNIKFYEPGSDYSKKKKVELFPGYGKQSKYTLKANYIDYSQARNVVSGDIWGDVVRARKNKNELSDLPNGGAIDGYPVLVFENNIYQGLYTLNIPKDGWMLGMENKSGKQALISTNTWNDSVALREHIADDYSNGWEIEYCSTEDDETIGTSWITTSFNEFMDFLNHHDGEELKAGLSGYVDIEAAIDTLIYTSFIYGEDNTAKNMLWASYDGKKWIPSVYDMDGSWGLRWDGAFAFSPTSNWFPSDCNNLWTKIWTNYHDETISRYQELRNGPLSLNNIDEKFSNFFSSVPEMLYASESEKWSDVPSQSSNHETQIMSWAAQRAKTMDSFFNTSIDEKCYSASFNVADGVSSLFIKEKILMQEEKRVLLLLQEIKIPVDWMLQAMAKSVSKSS